MTNVRRSAPVRFGSIRAKPPLALPGERIGLLGGSFNPPHAAHLMISRIALRRLKLHRIWWIVTPGNPLKTHGELESLDERLAACRALARDPRIVVTDFEARLPTAYTAATLNFLKTRSPLTHFVWVMGADNLAGFHRWQQWREIGQMMPIAIVDRPRWRLRAVASRAGRALANARLPEGRAADLATAKSPAWIFLTGPLSSLSSTYLRQQRSLQNSNK